MSTSAELDAIAERIKAARVPEDLFGKLAAPHHLTLLEKLYRKLVSVVHPDKHSLPADHAVALAAFTKATEMHDQAKLKIAAGTYGELGAVAVTAAVAKMPTVVRVRDRSYVVHDVFAHGDLCDLYACSYMRDPVVFKLACSAADNDLVENEGRMLARLYPASAKDEAYYRYLPRPIDSFAYRGSTNKTVRRVNVMARAEGYFSMAEVRRAYPDGLDFRDVVWMLNRMLSALGWVHSQRVVHGAILPEHVLVHPVSHGAKLVDWCYAVERGKTIRAISKAHRDSYPPEVLAKQAATPAADIYMATRLAQSLMKSPPEPIKRFLQGCQLSAPGRRPDNAFALKQELDELLHALVGERKYRPLAMPAQGD